MIDSQTPFRYNKNKQRKEVQPFLRCRHAISCKEEIPMGQGE